MGATGEKVDIDPETFKILDGKLYLFYNQLFNNTKNTWNKDEKKIKARADLNWQCVRLRSLTIPFPQKSSTINNHNNQQS